MAWIFPPKAAKRQGHGSALIVAGGTGCKAPGLENPIKIKYHIISNTYIKNWFEKLKNNLFSDKLLTSKSSPRTPLFSAEFEQSPYPHYLPS
jgi:hypothetical protein